MPVNITANQTAHNDFQRHYYETALDKPSMQVAETPYIHSHLKRMIEAAELIPSNSILEVGAGLGKFSIPLMRQGFSLACLDISPVMLDQLSKTARQQGLHARTLFCDAAEVAVHTEQT